VSPGRSQEPLALKPKRGISRKLLVLLFVLLTVAALVIGALVVRRMQGASDIPFIGQTTSGAGSVARQDDASNRQAAFGTLPAPAHRGGAR
jgi:hypothetical protein